MRKSGVFRHVDRKSLELLPVSLAVHDTQSNIVWANKYYRGAIGLSLEEIEGRKCYALFGLDDKCPGCPVIRALETGEEAEAELTPDNQPQWPEELGSWLIKAASIRDEKGRIIGAVAVGQDITESKQAEKDLLQSEHKFRSLVEQAAEMLFLHDTGGRILDVNRLAEKSTGYSRDELLRMDVFELDPDAKERNDLERFWKSIRPEDPPITFEVRHLRKDGSIYPSEVTLSKVELADGEYILALARDITERKKAEEHLYRQREMLARTEEIARVGSWEWDIASGQGSWSREIFNIFGLDPASGAPAFEEQSRIYVPEDLEKLKEAVEECRTEGTPYELELTAVRSDGEIRHCIDFGRAERDADGKIHRLVGYLQDITERRKVQEDRDNLRAKLLQSQKMESVGRLAGGVAHEYNNMLSVILGNTELARELVPPDHPVQSNLEDVMAAASRSADLTRQLLTFARLQPISTKVIGLNEAMEDIIKMLHRIIGEDIELDWQPGSGLWQVKMDPAQIEQVLACLCVNSRDAITGIGRITIRTENETLDESYCCLHPDCTPGDFVMLSVSDDGCGMDHDILEIVFEPFFTTKKEEHGIGLGLPTVYGIVRQNKGHISVISEVGKGTTVKLYLPRHQGEKHESGSGCRVKAFRGRGEVILLVEDEPAIMKMSKMALEKLGYEVLAAGLPGEALKLAEERHGDIDLLITDVVMPEMNGSDLADHFLSFCPDAGVLFMSGYTADVIENRGELNKGVNFIQKPFSREGLGVRIREVLDQTQPAMRQADNGGSPPWGGT